MSLRGSEPFDVVPTIPCTSKSSPVIVPVLSKQQTSTRPAYGIRNGSVQKMACLASATSEALTAIDSSMGSSGGTTDVIISTQSSMSLPFGLFILRPFTHTYALAAIAKMSKKAINTKLSQLLADTRFSLVNTIKRIRRPCVVPKPVRNTIAKAPPSGGAGTPSRGSPGVTCKVLVPPNRQCCLSAPWSLRMSVLLRSVIPSFSRGVLSPESIASFTIAEPEARITSQGNAESALVRVTLIKSPGSNSDVESSSH